MSTADLESRLRTLEADIWTRHPPCGRQIGWSEERRALTSDEWDLVRSAAKGLVVVPHNACMGFGFGVQLFAHPIFPGLAPERLIDVTNKHISDQARFFDGWNLMWPWANTEQNRKWLEMYGFEPLRDQAYYDY